MTFDLNQHIAARKPLKEECIAHARAIELIKRAPYEKLQRLKPWLHKAEARMESLKEMKASIGETNG